MPERQCHTCTSDQKVEWGCYAKKVRYAGEDEDEREAWDNPAALPVTIKDEDHYACPRQHIRENDAWWNTVMMLYSAYDQGHLPDAGGVTDQSHAGMQVLTLLKGLFSEARAQVQD